MHMLNHDAARLQSGDRVLVVANPSTRRRIDPIFAELRATAPEGVELDFRMTQAGGDANVIAREHAPGAAMVIAIGGDGTVSEVAGNLDHGKIPLGIISAGSTNIIARELGIPNDMRQAVALIWGSHQLRRIDAGTCNGTIFLHMAGAGFDSRFFDLTDRRLKRKVGWIAYLPAAVKALGDDPVTYHIKTVEQEFDVVSPLVLVANGPSIINPRLKLSHNIRKDDGWLDVLIVTATKPVELARTLGRLATLQFEKSPYVTHLRIREMELSAQQPMPVQLDGDVLEQTPVRFGILPSEVSIICPAT
ncbi:MAG: diacylglycerol kinase family protein [Thermomicrobiales bacterium]